uniref:Uncharacterized protein n=1 Tax=Virus NIOZ-UU159 TaxID=2763270 RepID=A0A7S9XHM0_9VIRU|nr:MAG: hypothetical protein NIOZUU159_00275 [Virus NIOZ-UU159]|tara:strand:+ start:2079 stop:2300 length:222 start_codon:yes stop_codon:yes gene_type:complete
MFSRRIITLVIYLIIVAIIFMTQPYIMFDDDSNMKKFGYKIDDETTTIPVILVLPLLALILYLTVLMIELIYI